MGNHQPPPDPDPYASLCARCKNSQIEEATYESPFDGDQPQSLVHCLKLHQTIWWSPENLFGQTQAPRRLPTHCTGFREQKDEALEAAPAGLPPELAAVLRAFDELDSR